MRLKCPACGAVYDVPDTVIGANGRRVRCRACQTSWFEPPPEAIGRPIERVAAQPRSADLSPPPASGIDAPRAFAGRESRRRAGIPWLLLLLGLAVVALGAVAAVLALGPDLVANRLGLAERRVPLGIAITREPDWRLIAGGSRLFAVSGRIWNPTTEAQPVPDIRAELSDHAGRRVYTWTIARPVGSLPPGAAVTFDGAAVDVPASSAKVAVSFAGADGG